MVGSGSGSGGEDSSRKYHHFFPEVHAHETGAGILIHIGGTTMTGRMS